MKRLHRLIVTSSAYRMASSPSGKVLENVRSDRENRYLWRFPSRRLEAEAIRDGILHAAGALDTTMGGQELDNREESASRRRSLYYSVYAEDGGAMRFLATFDAPDTCDAYRRSESVLPQQALALTNSRTALDCGRLLARKLWAECAPGPGREDAFLRAAFQQVLSREPGPAEAGLCREFLSRPSALFRAGPAPSGGGGVPPSPDPALRAAESLVQSLFSHHDFLTLR